MAKILRYVLALARTVVEGVTIEGDAIVVSAGPRYLCSPDSLQPSLNGSAAPQLGHAGSGR